MKKTPHLTKLNFFSSLFIYVDHGKRTTGESIVCMIEIWNGPGVAKSSAHRQNFKTIPWTFRFDRKLINGKNARGVKQTTTKKRPTIANCVYKACSWKRSYVYSRLTLKNRHILQIGTMCKFFFLFSSISYWRQTGSHFCHLLPL